MKIPKQAFTTEFRELVVKRVKDGQSVSRVCKELGLSDQTIRNWVKAAAEGKLIHALAAIYHHTRLKDKVLVSMLP